MSDFDEDGIDPWAALESAMATAQTRETERDEARATIATARRLLLSVTGAKFELSTYWYEAADAWLKQTRAIADSQEEAMSPTTNP